jgi:hypothetical protein
MLTTPVREAIRRGLAVAAVVWLALSIEIVLSNVVLASPQDDDDGIAVGLSYLAVFTSFLVIGRLAAHVAHGWRPFALAGAVAGAFIGSFTAGTFFAVDNIFLSTISQQQTKIDGLAASGMTSMRAYVNHSLIGPLIFWTVLFAVFGAVLAVAGGFSARPKPA